LSSGTGRRTDRRMEGETWWSLTVTLRDYAKALNKNEEMFKS
jgi:hypothetical protein